MKSRAQLIYRLLLAGLLSVPVMCSHAQNDTLAAASMTRPSFPGGISAWRKYLEQNLNYPAEARRKNAQGVVKVQLTVAADGKISDVKAMNDPGYGLAEEAVRVVANGPAWTPATRNGNPVNYPFMQAVTFSLGGTTTMRQLIAIRNVQTIVLKTTRFYNGKSVEAMAVTEDRSGLNIITTDKRSYFENRAASLEIFGVNINDQGFTVPGDARVLYYDNNGIAIESYSNMKFTGGNHNFRVWTLYKPATRIIDTARLPVFVLNGNEVAADKKYLNPYAARAFNLLTFDESAQANYGDKFRNGVLMLSTKLPFPDNYLYLLDGKESSNEEIAKLPPGTIDSLSSFTGKRATEMYGEKAVYGVVKAITKKPGNQLLHDTIYSKTSVPASFPGGSEGLKTYLATNMRYPATATKNNIEGTVRVYIMISPDGTITRAMALNDPGNGLADEAVRLLKEGPKWKPATIKGRNVAYTLAVPIMFKLDHFL